MTHERYQLWMSLALDGELPPDKERELRQHLAECAECRALWRAWMSLDERFREEPVVGPAPGFVARVNARLDARRRQRQVLGGLVVVAGSAVAWSALLTLLGLGVVWWLAGGSALVPQVAHLASSLGAILRVLFRTALVVWESLVAAPTQSLVLGYAVIVLGLAILWASALGRWRPRRGGANSGQHT
ncbi:MAG: zf-HC2 domain-containing protein [Anaerolineae bacterium]|nr:zf-HC2 domain-containing protein [Anaerolineae bacterium]